MAEVNGREGLHDDDSIIQLKEVYVDSTVGSEQCTELSEACGDYVTVHVGRRNLKTQIYGCISKTELKICSNSREGDSRRMDQEEQQERHMFSFILVFEYGERTLQTILDHYRITAGSFLAKELLQCIAEATLSLHVEPNKRIHGNLKPHNIVTVGTKVKLIDLDISCKIGETYGQKAPSSGFCPPEVLNRMPSNSSQDSNGDISLQSLPASIAHDLFSFGVIFYRIETGQPLFLTNQDDNVVGEDIKCLKNWNKRSMKKKFKNVNVSNEAKEIISKLLDPDPVQRVRHFRDTSKTHGDDFEMMGQVLKDPYFS